MASRAVLTNHVDVHVPVNTATTTVQAPNGAANFLIPANEKHVKNYERSGNDLIIQFDDGKELRINGFFAHSADYNNLVFVHDDGQWLTVFDKALGGSDGIVDPLVAYDPIADSSTGMLLAILGGVAGAAGIVALAAGGGGSSSSPAPPPPPPPPGQPAAPTSYNDKVYPVVDAHSTAPYTNDVEPGINIGAGLTTGLTNTPKLYVDGVYVAATYNSAAGTLTPNAPLPEGNHQFTYTVSNSSGESPQSGALPIGILTTPPGPPIWALTDDRSGVQRAIGDQPTNDATPALHGTGGHPGDTVNIVIDNKPPVTVTVGADGAWTYTPGTPLVDGEHHVTVTETDPAGNVSTATDQYVMVDTIALAPTVALLHDTGISATDLITMDGTLSVTGIETGATVEYSTDSGVTWSTGFTATEGANDVLVRQTDVAGNVSAPTEFIFTLDTTAPAAPMVALLHDTGASATDLITMDGTLSVTGIETGATVEYSTDSGVTWSTSFTPVEGANDVLVRQTDVAGNVSAPTEFSFTLDTTPPAVELKAITDNVELVTGPIHL
ncbi:MAG: Ig-like domain-containing protein, partial [Desulfobulbaceae bacterium]|nr:Ig-like domain-containing protein [Desulfobulbaceae bacterium]